LNLEKNRAKNDLFDVFIVQQDKIIENFDPENLMSFEVNELKSLESPFSKFDITFWFVENDDEITLKIIYNKDLFDEERMIKLSYNLKNILKKILNNPSKVICEIDYLTIKEKFDVLNEYNIETDLINTNEFIEALTTGTWEDSNTLSVSQDDLDSQNAINDTSRQFAYFLKKKYGVSRNNLMVIKQNSAFWKTILILSALKLGSSYVIIHSDEPEESTDEFLDTIDFKLIVDENILKEFQIGKYSGVLDDEIKTIVKDNSFIVYHVPPNLPPIKMFVENNSLLGYIAYSHKKNSDSNFEDIFQNISNQSIQFLYEKILLYQDSLTIINPLFNEPVDNEF
jgi:hypothetical protein